MFELTVKGTHLRTVLENRETQLRRRQRSGLEQLEADKKALADQVVQYRNQLEQASREMRPGPVLGGAIGFPSREVSQRFIDFQEKGIAMLQSRIDSVGFLLEHLSDHLEYTLSRVDIDNFFGISVAEEFTRGGGAIPMFQPL